MLRHNEVAKLHCQVAEANSGAWDVDGVPLHSFLSLIVTLRISGQETVCGQTVSELIDLLGLPDFLDGIVATARGFICSALSLQVRDASQPQALQGYFDTLRQIILKLKELGKL